MDTRPNLTKDISITDFKEFYWLKSELMNFCRELKISSSGGKIEIANRIAEYLETGKISKKIITKKPKLPKAIKPLTEETIIGVEQRTYKEKKEFLKSIIGNHFHFTIHLLDYFKENIGKKTYGELIQEWYKEQKINRDPNFVKEITPQFEYNTYIRDFMKDNPNTTKKIAIQCWNIKRRLRGDNKYEKSDLQLIE